MKMLKGRLQTERHKITKYFESNSIFERTKFYTNSHFFCSTIRVKYYLTSNTNSLICYKSVF